MSPVGLSTPKNSASMFLFLDCFLFVCFWFALFCFKWGFFLLFFYSRLCWSSEFLLCVVFFVFFVEQFALCVLWLKIDRWREGWDNERKKGRGSELIPPALVSAFCMFSCWHQSVADYMRGMVSSSGDRNVRLRNGNACSLHWAAVCNGDRVYIPRATLLNAPPPSFLQSRKETVLTLLVLCQPHRRMRRGRVIRPAFEDRESL